MISSLQISGVHVVLDLDGFTVSQATHITPSFAMALSEWVQRCLPCRLKGIHLANNPFIFNMVFALFKPFLAVSVLDIRVHLRTVSANHTGTVASETGQGTDYEIEINELDKCFLVETETEGRMDTVKSIN